MPLRVRLALSFAAIVLVLFTVSGFLFERSFRHGLVDSVDRGLRSQVQVLAQQVSDPSTPLELGEQSPQSVLRTKDVVAQVLDPSGRVIASTQEAGARPVVGRSVIRRARRHRIYVDVKVGKEREPERVAVQSVERGAERRIVLVGSSLEETNSTVARVRNALLAGGAGAVILAGAGAWLLAGAALRPVERMRRQAADISEHDTQSRLQVPGTHDEIAALAATMNDLLARLHGALDRQRAFVADAGHELRTPLAVLRTELELAGRSDRSLEELRDAIAHAAEETDRVARLAEQLLFLARSDAARTEVLRDDVDVRALLERSIAALAARAELRHVTVRLDVARDLRIVAAPDLLRQAVDNVLDNALRYAPDSSTVTVTSVRSGKDIEITVRDGGPGFPADFLPHAFERFRRADDARSQDDGGAGLGLAITRAVVEAHGGSAAASNGTSSGALLTLRIPTHV